MAVGIKNAVFVDVKLYSFVDRYQCFGQKLLLHLRSRRDGFKITLKMEVAHCAESWCPCTRVNVFDIRTASSGLDAEFFEEYNLKTASGKLKFNSI